MSNESPTDLRVQLLALDTSVRSMLAEDLPVQLAAIRQALAKGEFDKARHDVHAVRGSAAFCKLVALCHAATQLEASLARNDNNADQTRAFENNVERVLQVLEHEIENG